MACVEARACVSVLSSVQLKAHFASGRLINNSSAAQWDHKSVDGTMKDINVRAGGVHGQPDRFTHHTIGWTVNTPSVFSFLNAYRNCLNSSTKSVVKRCKQTAGKSSGYPVCNRCWWGAVSLSRRCQYHICCQGANSHDDTVPESLKKTQLAQVQGGGCFFFQTGLVRATAGSD